MKIEDFNLGSLHDSVLKSVEFNWENKRAIILLEPNEINFPQTEFVTINATGVNHLKIDNKAPWGQSVFINELKYISSRDYVQLKFEMQSGDIILIEAKFFEVNL